MVDATESNPDRPRGRVAELVTILRGLGFAEAADTIVTDIERRSLAHLQTRPTPEVSSTAFMEIAKNFPDNGEFQPEVHPYNEGGRPLSNLEQRIVALRVLELVVVNPFRMLEQVQQINEVSKTEEQGREVGSLPERVGSPLLLMVDDSQATPWSEASPIALVAELRSKLPELEQWLADDDLGGVVS